MFKEMAVFLAVIHWVQMRGNHSFFQHPFRKPEEEETEFFSFLFYLLCERSRAHPYRQNHADIFSIKHDLDVIFLC